MHGPSCMCPDGCFRSQWVPAAQFFRFFSSIALFFPYLAAIRTGYRYALTATGTAIPFFFFRIFLFPFSCSLLLFFPCFSRRLLLIDFGSDRERDCVRNGGRDISDFGYVSFKSSKNSFMSGPRGAYSGAGACFWETGGARLFVCLRSWVWS